MSAYSGTVHHCCRYGSHGGKWSFLFEVFFSLMNFIRCDRYLSFSYDVYSFERRQINKPNHQLILYDHLSSQTLNTLELLLLHFLSHEPSQSIGRKSVDTVCELADNSMSRGPWNALQAQAFSMCQGANPGLGAYRGFSGCPNLVMDL
jgi:hypothetical protein